MATLHDIVEPWLLQADTDDLIKLRDELIWLKAELYDEYEPAPYHSFDDRLTQWLQNVAEEDDRKALFRLLSHFFFIGKRQFNALCIAAFSDDVVRWITDDCNLDITNPNVSQSLKDEVDSTWFCPITDSMRINSFLKLNNLSGHSHRPDWRSMQEFGDERKISDYVNDCGIKRLVLLEDFVGSGNQMRSSVAWASRVLPFISILVIPLVCAPAGVEAGKKLSALHNVSFCPTLLLREELFLQAVPTSEQPQVFDHVRNLVIRTRHRLGYYGREEPFGYEGTGALVAMYSNCPDNSLPLFHYFGLRWNPLFARVNRS